MQFSSNALRFSPASVGALIEPDFLRSVVHDVESPTHPDADLARSHATPARAWYAPAAAMMVVAGHWLSEHTPHWPTGNDW